METRTAYCPACDRAIEVGVVVAAHPVGADHHDGVHGIARRLEDLVIAEIDAAFLRLLGDLAERLAPGPVLPPVLARGPAEHLRGHRRLLEPRGARRDRSSTSESRPRSHRPF